MHNVKRSAVLLAICLSAPALLAQQAAPAKTEKFQLTVDSIMRGPDLVGYAPDGLRWSSDSQKLYFDWRKPGEEEASTYWIPKAGGAPAKLSDADKKNIPTANARWDKARKRALFADRGDIVIIEGNGTRRWITRTTGGRCRSRARRPGPVTRTSGTG